MNFADALSAAQTATATAAGAATGSPLAAGYANLLLGQGAFIAQLGDLGQKINDGTAQDTDYAEVIKAAGDTLLVTETSLTSMARPQWLKT